MEEVGGRVENSCLRGGSVCGLTGGGGGLGRGRGGRADLLNGFILLLLGFEFLAGGY